MSLLRNAIGLAKSPAAAFAPPTGPATGAAGGGLLHGMLKAAAPGPAAMPAMPAMPGGPARMSGFLSQLTKPVTGTPMPTPHGGLGGAAAGLIGKGSPGLSVPSAPPSPQETQAGALGAPSSQGNYAQALKVPAPLMGDGGGGGPQGDALMAALRGVGGGMGGIGAPAGKTPPPEALMAALRGGGAGPGAGLGEAIGLDGLPTRGGGMGGGIRNVMQGMGM